MKKTAVVFCLILGLVLISGCAKNPVKRAETPVVPQTQRVDAVPVEHQFAREIQAENCIRELLNASHDVERTAGLTRATQACSSIWLSHERKVSDWRMIQDYKRDNQDVMPVKLDSYDGSFLKVDFEIHSEEE